MLRRLLAGVSSLILILMFGFILPARSVEIVPEAPRLTIMGAADDDWELYSVAIDGGPVRRLTDDTLQNEHPQVSPDGRWLLYEQRDHEQKAVCLFLRNTDSPTGHLLTGIESAAFTPDSRLLFTENIPNKKGILESWIGVMASDGTNKRLYRQGRSPIMSPNGQQIAFTDLFGDVLLINTEGKSEAVSFGKGIPIAFNRDASLLVVSREYLMNHNDFQFPVVHVLSGDKVGAVYELAESARRNSEQCWGFLPDGRLLCTRDGEGIFLTDPQRRTFNWVTRSEDWAPEVTSDGLTLVFLRLRGMWAQLCRINLDGTNFVPITSGLVDTPDYTITSDGKTIIFSALAHQGFDAASIVSRTPFSIAPAPPTVINRNGIGLVPLRYLADQIGAEVSWDAIHKQVIVTRLGKEYLISLLETPKQHAETYEMANDTLFAPVREFIERLGGKVMVTTDGNRLQLGLPGLGRPLTMLLQKRPLLTSDQAIFLFSLDGAVKKRLDFHTSWWLEIPLLSPDGKWLVIPGQSQTFFEQSVFMPGKSGIIIRRADDPTERSLLPALPAGASYTNFAFSPDGATLLFSRIIEVRTPVDEGGNQSLMGYRDELALITLADGTVRELGVGREPVFSPDGQRIAFTRDNQVWLVRQDGAEARIVGSGFAPCFTPDGSQLLVHELRDHMSFNDPRIRINASLVLYKLTGTMVLRLGSGTIAGFSPDGKILYSWQSRVRPEDRTHELYLGAMNRIEHTSLRGYRLDADKPEEVVLTGVFQQTALGATHIVGVSQTNGSANAEIFAAPLTGGPARLLAKGQISNPQFTTDGRYLLFIKDGDICLVNVDGGDVAQVTWGVTVYNYSLTPDGTHLLVFGSLRE